MPRTIDGPDWPTDYGTAEQCAAYVGIKDTLWLALDAAGLILPPAARASRQTACWHWHAAVCVRLNLIHLTAQLRSTAKDSQKKVVQTGRASDPEDEESP